MKRLIRYLMYRGFKSLLHIEAHGIENIPDKMPAIIVANHSSYMDIPTMGIVFNRHIASINWVVSKENYGHFVLKWLYIVYKPIVVNGTVRKAKAALDRGEGVLIFPEGAGRWCCLGQEEKIKVGTGAAVIGLTSGAPIVPVRIIGTDKVMPPRTCKLQPIYTIGVYIGKPFSLDKTDPERMDAEIIDKANRDIMNRIKELAPRACG